MPKRPRSHELEDLSINELQNVFVQAGCTVEKLSYDYGEDLLVRIFDQHSATPQSFFVQAKATDNIEKYFHKDKKSLAFPINASHLKHWGQFWEPVVITVWDAKSNITYWECIQTFLESQRGKKALQKKRKTIRIVIPTDNLLDEEGIKRIFVRTNLRFNRFKRERDGAQVLIELLEEALNVKIDYSPQDGLLQLTYANGEHEFIMFGKFLAKIEEIQAETGETFDEILKRAVRTAHSEVSEIVEAISKGYKVPVKTSDGEIIQFESVEDWIRYHDREMELLEFIHLREY